MNVVHKSWNVKVPTGIILGVDVLKYVYSPYRGWHDPDVTLERIAPSFEGEEFSPSGYQIGHYVSLNDLIYGNDSLKFIKKWPRDARLEAGKFLRMVWGEWRRLGYSRWNTP